MSIFGNLITRTLGLTEQSRQALFRAFGSFYPKLFFEDSSNLLIEGYEKSVEAYAIIKKIVDTAGTIPYKVERKVGGEWEQVDDSDINKLLANPNPLKGYDINQINAMLDTYTLADGNGFLLVDSARMGAPVLDVLPSDKTKVKVTGNYFDPAYKYVFKLDNEKYVFDQMEVGHMKMFNPSFKTLEESARGLSLVQVAGSVIQSANDKWEAQAWLMQNRGISGMVTDKSNRVMRPSEVDEKQEEFDRRTSGLNKTGKVIVTNKDLDYISMAMSPSDLQLLEQGVVNLRAICNVFGLDSSLFNDPANKTFNNRKEAEKALYTNAVMPLVDKRVDLFNKMISRMLYPMLDHRIVADYSDIEALQEDFHEKAKTVALLKNSGIITANRGAEILGQPMSEDDNADKLIISTTLVEELQRDEQRDQS